MGNSRPNYPVCSDKYMLQTRGQEWNTGNIFVSREVLNVEVSDFATLNSSLKNRGGDFR